MLGLFQLQRNVQSQPGGQCQFLAFQFVLLGQQGGYGALTLHNGVGGLQTFVVDRIIEKFAVAQFGTALKQSTLGGSVLFQDGQGVFEQIALLLCSCQVTPSGLGQRGPIRVSQINGRF